MNRLSEQGGLPRPRHTVVAWMASSRP